MLTTLSFGVALALSWLLHAGVEKPARKLLLRKRSLPTATPPLPVQRIS